MPTAAASLALVERVAALSAEQRVALLVGVCLHVLREQALGRLTGPLHPHRVSLDVDGRPIVARVELPDSWTAQDDVVAVLRFARHLEVDVGPAVSVTLVLEELRNRAVAALPLVAPPGPGQRLVDRHILEDEA